jgi:hypothetical protein
VSRYYDIKISDPKTNKVIRHWTSHPNGPTQPPDPGALNIEFDIVVSNFGEALGTASTVTIEGVPIGDLFQPQQFVGMNFSMLGGMGKGLPLANPKQAGVLISGQVFQAFGNWQGVDMSLDLVVVPVPSFTLDNPGNFSVDWASGVPISVMISQVLSRVYPSAKQNIQIKPGIVLPNHEWATISTLRQFSSYVNGITDEFFDDAYIGVNICVQGGEFFVYDGTQSSVTVPFLFNDFVGQPTWIEQNQILVKTVMRGDIQVGNTVTMPEGLQDYPGIVTTSGNSFPSSNKYKAAFQGNFNVGGSAGGVRHVGNFRSPDGADWVSLFYCTTGLG